MSVSLEPFKDKTDAEIAAECEAMRRTKALRPDEPKTPKRTMDETIKALNERFRNTPVNDIAIERELAIQKQEVVQRKSAALWDEANVPDRQAKRLILETTTERGLRWHEALKKIHARGDDALIALIGINGNGKTQLAVEMIRSYTARQKSALWTTATDFLMDVKACYRDEAKSTEREVIARYVKPHLLVIDEIHRRKGSEWENGLLFSVIDKMYNAGKPVIVIANQTREEFEHSTDSSIVSRMAETGGIIECNWASFRE